MGETAQMDLKDPQPSDWDQFHKESKGSKYQVPPPATKDGREVVYYGQLPTQFPDEFLGDYNEYRKYTLCSREAPIKLVRNGNGADGYLITRPPFVSLSPWKNGYNGAMGLLKSAGSAAKPQTTAQYDAAVRQTAGKVASFTIDWQAYDKETADEVKGYGNFPNDPERPGQKKAILVAGDVLPNGEVVRAAKLFARAEIKFFRTANKKDSAAVAV